MTNGSLMKVKGIAEYFPWNTTLLGLMCIYMDVYNQATTKLAFDSNEKSIDKLSIILKWLSIIVIQVHAKLHKNVFISTCSLHWNIKK